MQNHIREEGVSENQFYICLLYFSFYFCYFKHESLLGSHTLRLNPQCDNHQIKAQAEQVFNDWQIKFHPSGSWLAWKREILVTQIWCLALRG